ncbi:MAG: hypothetical protein Q4C54_07415, partial [Clostridia bacterium]|nr:hypothetical protein [Clostridia bacterium]
MTSKFRRFLSLLMAVAMVMTTLPLGVFAEEAVPQAEPVVETAAPTPEPTKAPTPEPTEAPTEVPVTEAPVVTEAP